MNQYIIPYTNYHSPHDPCPPLTKYYVTTPNLYLGMQPYGLEQFSPKEALKHGTLWKALYGPYNNPYETKTKGDLYE